MEILCYLDSGYAPPIPEAPGRGLRVKSFIAAVAAGSPPFTAALLRRAGVLVQTLRAALTPRALTVIGAAALCAILGWAGGYGLFVLGGAIPLPAGALSPKPSAYELDALDRVMTQFVFPLQNEVDEAGALSGSPETGKVPYTKPVEFTPYTVNTGDNLTSISRRFGLRNISTLISVNGIQNARRIRPGQTLSVPSIDGIFYTVAPGDTITGISAKHNIIVEDILDVNDMNSTNIRAGTRLFLPGARLDQGTLRKSLGELFSMPLAVSWRLSSPFGIRPDPFTGAQSQHTGIDMAAPAGASIYASLGGKVVTAAYSNVYGNYVVIDHGNGYQTLYGHMQKSLVKKGSAVAQGDKIGLVGSTGYSTGPHLHFSVYKNGRLINPLSILKR
ncbi:MAG: M23 family metallopeptidase [Spirochaetaceae bacterium]|jgi:murein DD-endopeptidase MepM/ murein hydrolase activator NlpD|nr:M23 family metallopeptidase [Spirochaetaceae bacterium]